MIFPYRGAASERNLIDIRVLHNRSSAGFAEAGNHVDDARRQAAIGKNVLPVARAVNGVCSAGLSTQVQPAAIAGASFHAAISKGSSTG